MTENVNKKKYIIIGVIAVLVVSIVGTLAWYTFGTKKSSLVLVLGNSDELLITLSPYELNIVADPVTNYTSMTDYVSVTATNSKTVTDGFRIYYDIEEIDSNLVSTAMKYAVTRSGTKNGTYTQVATGSFSGSTSGEHKVIYTESVPATTTYYYKFYTYLDGNSSNSNMEGKVLKTTIGAEFGDTLYSIIADAADTTTTVNFLGAQTGLFILSSTASDTYPVYFYRGKLDNNNVYFANKCWKIIRTTGTGGVKLIYNGTNSGTAQSPECANNDVVLSSSIAFNSSYTSAADVGYMYGTRYESTMSTGTGWYYAPDVTYSNGTYTLTSKTISGTTYNVETKSSISDSSLMYHHYTCGSSTETTCSQVRYAHGKHMYNNSDVIYITLSGGKKVEDALNEMLTNSTDDNDSTIKAYIDDWYSNSSKGNMTGYTQYLEDTIWCNDRSIYQLNGWNPNGGSVRAYLYFGAQSRGTLPIVTCPNRHDAFTVNDITNGNGKLTYPVGLLTVDEQIMSGQLIGSNIQTEVNYWSGSPSAISSYGYGAMNYYVNFYPNMSNSTTFHVVNNVYGVRPVISLKLGIRVTKGSGDVSDPYIIN